jgi:hypothetical protein
MGIKTVMMKFIIWIREANDSIINQYSRSNTEDDKNLNYDLSANFKKTFKTKGEEWTADAFYSSNNSQENLDAVQHYDDLQLQQRTY